MTAYILVVEDNEYNLELVHYLLEVSGYRIALARNGEEGLAEVRRRQPDLILSDLQMPVMDGYQMLEQLRQDPVFASIPIIAITAFSMRGDEQRIRAAGFDDYIAKPIDPETFIARVEQRLPPDLRAIRPGGTAPA